MIHISFSFGSMTAKYDASLCQSQRDWITRPRVARNELPWVNRPRNLCYPERVKSSCSPIDSGAHNHSGIDATLSQGCAFGALDPMFVRSSQPWAERFHPFRIRLGIPGTNTPA